MRKLLLFITLLIFIIPGVVNAASKGYITITGPETASENDKIKIYIKAKIDRFDGKEGVAAILAGFRYEEEALRLDNITSTSGFINELEKDGNVQYVISTFENPEKSNNTCVENILFCGEFIIEIEFTVLSKERTSTSIDIVDFEIGIVSADLIEVVSNIEDAIYLLPYSSSNYLLILNPESIVNNTPNTPKNNKSNNNNLKEIKIQDYEIDFNKDNIVYNLTIPNNINRLDVSAIAENNNAKVEISGNDDLTKIKNTIVIKVTAEDDTIKTYNVFVTKSEDTPIVEKDDDDEKSWIDKAKDKLETVNKKVIIIAASIVGFIIVILIIVGIKNKINDREIDKLLDKM